MLQLRHPFLYSKFKLLLLYCALALIKTSEATIEHATMHVMSELKYQIERLQGRIHEIMVRL